MLVTAVLSVCATTVAAAGSGQEALKRMKNYEYGQSTEAFQTVKRQVYGSLDDRQQRERLARQLAGLLEGDASFACKQFVCRQLALIGTEEQVPALSQLLADEKLSHAALYALTHIESPEVDEALRKALEHTSGRRKVGIINCLGRRGDEEAVEVLGDLLDSKDGEVASASAAALGEIGGEEARRLLLEAFKARAGSRQAVADANLACAERLSNEGKQREAASIYRLIYKSNNPASIRAAALKGLAECVPTKEAVSLLLEAVSKADTAVRDAAGWQLRHVGGTEATRALAEKFPTLSTSSKVMLLSVLGDRGDPAGLEPVRKACESGNDRVRLTALEALGELGGESEVRFLAQTAAGASGAEARVARESLSTLSGADVNQRMAQLVTRAEPDVAVELIQGLAARSATETTRSILRLTESDNGELRRAAFNAISGLAGEDDLRALIELIEKVRPSDRAAAESALLSVLQRGDREQVKEIVGRYRSAKNTEIRQSWLRILAGLGGEKARTVLGQALESDASEIRVTAIRMLSEWQTPAPRSDLLEVARTTDDTKERTLALRGYLHLIDIDKGLSPEETIQKYREVSELANQPAEVRMILSGLADVRSPEALQTIEGYLEDGSVRDEAALAAVQIAEQIWGSYPDRCRQTMERVLEVSESKRVRDQAEQVLRATQTMNGYITAWQVAGPYKRAGMNDKELFNVAFAPEKDDEQATWSVMPVSGGPPVILNLMSIGGGNNRVAYLRTRVWSEKKRNARLELGSDDGIKVWLNDKVVHANNTNRGCQPGEDTAKVTFQEGWNRLMMKITQGGGGWAACARVTAPDGSLMDGIRFRVPE